MPDSAVPGSAVPGSAIPGSSAPRKTVPGSTVPGSAPGGAPSGAVPGGTRPGSPGAAPGQSIGWLEADAATKAAQTRGRPPKAARGKASASPAKTPRRAQLAVVRIEPWSVMKFSFVISLVCFIVLFVAVAVLYGALAGLGVFDSLQKTIASVTSGQGSTGVNAATWFSASRVLGYTGLIGAVNVILITALSTVGAVLYNVASDLIGGIEVTLRETD